MTCSMSFKHRFGVCLIFGVLALFWGCVSGDETPDLPQQVVFTKENPACLTCHAGIENIHENVVIACTECHGGDFSKVEKQLAHVQPTLPVINDSTTPPRDYDLPYQRFVNPSNLRVVRDTCGTCHVPHVDWVMKSMMATSTGHHAGGLYLNGVDDTKNPTYGTFAVEDEDGIVPTDKGAVPYLKDLIDFDPSLDPYDFATHYRALPAQGCARCHLWSRGKGYRGAEGQDGLYRADGCAACHLLYANDGLSRSADKSISKTEKGHPMVHKITTAIPTEQCVHCHHRGARIGLNFTGRAEMPPRLPSGPGIAGTTDVKFNTSYHYVDSETNPQDIHGERGIHCIDCHTQAEIMGDGNIYGHMDQATKIECRMCHGLPGKDATLIDKDGFPLKNLQRTGKAVVLTSKVDGVKHVVPQIKDFTNPESPSFNAYAAAAMNEHHLKEQGGLECFSCHSAWNANCFGCHFERNETKEGLNLVTRETTMGQAATNNKMFIAFRHFSFGKNAQGKVSPYIVGCQPIADVTGADGQKLLDFVMPKTKRGLSGLSLNPGHTHTVRSKGEVRTCEECHRSPPSLGFGSGNFSLARDYSLVLGRNGLEVFDRWKDPKSPQYVITLDCGQPQGMAVHPNVVSGKADLVYVASGSSGLFVYDFRSGLPAEPLSVLADVPAIDVAVSAHILYVLVAGEGLRIYDTSAPENLRLLSNLALPTAQRLQLWGIDLFVAAGDQGLMVVDVADETQPRISGQLGSIHASDVELYAHFRRGPKFAARAYVIDPTYGVRFVDLLPEFDKPRLVGGYALPGAGGLDLYTRYVVASGDTPSREHDYLFVAGGSHGLVVLDVTDPDHVEEAAKLEGLGGNATDVVIVSHPRPPGVDDYAYIANQGQGLQLLDVTNPRDPQLLKTLPIAGAQRVFVEVQQLDRFIDEQGNELKENSHPGTTYFSRADFIRILRSKLEY